MIDYPKLIKISRAISKNASPAAFDEGTRLHENDDYRSTEAPMRAPDEGSEVGDIWQEHDSWFSTKNDVTGSG